MNKIWDLIKNEKVEWKSLGEIGVITGAGVDKKINDNEKFVTLLNYMDVYKNKYIDSLIPRMRVTASDKKIISCNVKKGDIFITPSSETKYDIFNTSVIAQDLRNTVYSYHIMRLRLKTYNWITSCYLNYYFDSQKFKEEIYKLVHGEIRFTISKSDIEKIKIPIPSIDTQNKIVKILDKFNIYVKELERELERRNKQYQHYRDMLLSENYLNSNCRNNLMNVDREIKWKKLGEFCEIGTGSSNRKDEVSDGMYPFFVRSKNILRSNKYEFDETAIIIPGEGGIGEIFHFIEGKYSLHQRAYRIKVLDTNINTKFIYHYLTNWFKEYILNIAVGATAASIRKPMIEDFEIPIPSLDIQNRIVKILDKFSELSENTKGLLPKEIQQRQEQYKYYRDKLLVFDNTHNPERERERDVAGQLSREYLSILEEAEKVEWKTIGEVCEIRKGEYITKKQAKDFGEFPVVSGGINPSYYHNKYNRDIHTITVGASGINAGYVNYWNTKIFLSDAYSIEPKDNIINKYLYYFLNSKQELIFTMKKGAGIPHVYPIDLSKIKIPIPSIDTQNKIVKILDGFSELTEGTKNSLPKEIKLRKQQYEYYRNKLLDFPKQ
ncbi:restriction endonuclease subunit S [Mycoplasmopsis anatis]|uniref:restriction endonuclease subunit S n=1 Tax=Mycoplasmopsis anatis TaxID=171279 RepID=UPI001C4DE92A|nr:restriction endonuclease subunit S [Mycoplasmopsis anatis]MBW0596942.1 hypothetical protein [Mycoplasmopsis anatis]MBW0603419.1 hypothetical protein [Mycoplasmopsis anatis]